MKLTTKFTALLIAILFMSACSNDDDDIPTIPTCTTLTTSASVNGDDSYTLQLAQLLAVGGGYGGTNYTFQVGAVNVDCDKSTILSISLEVSGDIGGTYPVVAFFDAGLDEASGGFGTQSLATASQTITDIESGSVTITDNGGNNFSIDFEGTLINNEDVSFATTHTF